MATLYTTLWLITSAYAAPLGYYGSADACKTAGDLVSLSPSAQVLCIPSEIAPAGTSLSPPTSMEPAGTAEAAPTADISKVSTQEVAYVGDPNAPVTMAYWFDYQCPFCRQLEATVIGRLMTEYVQPGKLKILFKNFAFLGPDSLTAALAADAVWEVAPDKFYQWHKAMFDSQGPENSGWATKDKIISLTKTIPGIDVEQVEKLMTQHAPQYQKAIDTDSAEGSSMGVNGTPGTIIGKQLLVGALSYQEFKRDIDSQLSAK